MTLYDSMMHVSKTQLAKSFSQAAKHYDVNADLQQTAGFILLPLLTKPAGVFHRVVDMGCGTGFFIPHLLARYPAARLIGIDIAAGMLAQAQAQYRCSNLHFMRADCHQVPLASHSVQTIYANLVFQWCGDFPLALRDCKRLLTQNGEMVFSILLEPSLRELRYSWRSLNPGNDLVTFQSADAVRDSVVNAGFRVNTAFQRTVVLKYPSVRALLSVMKSQGTNLGAFCSDVGLFTLSKLKKLEDSYRCFCGKDGLFPASYEVMFLHVS